MTSASASEGGQRLFRRVAVLGVGLIGGSIAGAARHRALTSEVVGYSPGDHAHRAHELGLVDRVCESPAEAVDGADLVVLAAPIPAMPALLQAIAPALAQDVIVTDAASTKRSTIQAARAALGSRFSRFVAGHPIAGAERHGPESSRIDLFNGCLALLCPQPETDPQALEQVSRFWAAIGARVLELDADEHDGIFAEVSHWPHAAVFALCAGIASGPRADDALRFAGAGLRDTTRIGASSASLWSDIILDNRDAVLECARNFQTELDAMIDALQRADRQTLLERFELASQWRQRLPNPGR